MGGVFIIELLLSSLTQFLFSGLAVGSIYALTALGFTIIYNTSGIVNFAQGEFVMLGGLVTAILYEMGLPLLLAAPFAICAACLAGALLHRLALQPARNAPLIALIIITVGASIFTRGAAQILFDQQLHRFPSLFGDAPFTLLGAAILPQSLVVVGAGILIFLLLSVLFHKTRLGLSIRATASNFTAARLVGVNTRQIMTIAFAMSAAAGALAGVLITPITLVSFDVGVHHALKGFAAMMLGGIGTVRGALLGGLLLGLIEALTAGYLSAAYKDAAAFVVILLVLFIRPQGLFGSRVAEGL